MFQLVLMLSIGSLSGPLTMPKTFATEQLCKSEGTNQSMSHLNAVPGDGGVKIAGFICLKLP